MKYILFILLVLFTFNASVNSQNNKTIFQSKAIEPVRMEMITEEHVLFDFGKDAFGTLELELQSTQTKPLIIHLGEKLAVDGTIERKPGGTIRYQKVTIENIPEQKDFILRLPRDKRNTLPQAIALPDSFGIIMPFRYCEIENLEIPLSDLKVKQRIFHYRFNDDASSFNCSDTILNIVWELCKYTIKATSFAGIYIDGDRERIPYEADAYINQLSHYCVDAEYDMAKESIRYFMKNPTWPTEWLLHTALMVYQDYYYTGDTTLLSLYYDELKEKTLFRLADEDGLISSWSSAVSGDYMHQLGFADTTQRISDIVDWPPAQKDTGWKLATAEGERDGHEMLPVNTVVNCFFYENMRIMSELATVLDRNEDELFFTEMAEKVKRSINTKLFDAEAGVYIDGIGSKHSSLHSNMLPLAFGLVPEQHRQSVTGFVKTRKMACSVYGAQYLLEGLYRYHEAEYALELMTATGDRSWWNMIRSGSTMTMEAWDMKYKPNLDWNHAWGSAPGNIVTRYLWGITPAEPGFDRVRIMPQMADLSCSEIKVPTIKGTIRAEYTNSERDGKKYVVDIPEGMDGNFVITGTEKKTKVLVNGKVYKAKAGIIELKGGENTIVLRY